MVRRSNRLSRKPRLDYKRYNSTGVIVTKGASPAKRIKSARATGALAQAITKVINRKAETKEVAWYGGPLYGGTYADAAYVNHNPIITSNTTDILRLIPKILPGTSDNQRIGERVRPVALQVNGSVRLSDGTINGVNAEFRDDVVVVIYVLQHVSLKDYANLQLSNNFLQLLRTGENDTAAFSGTVTDSQLPVEDAYYRLLSKKKIRLRYAGAIPGSAEGVPTNAVVSVANAHSYYADFSFNLTKHLPAQLKYPELSATTGQNDPTNSSIFMCMGFYNMDGQPALTQLVAIQYTSRLRFKDM